MINCKNCQNPTSNPNFCSRSCSATFTNRTHPKRTKKTKSTTTKTTKQIKNKVIYQCLFCNNQILGQGKSFCSRNCQSLHRISILVNNDSQMECRNAKKYLTFKYGHKCSICDIKEWQNKPLTMILDHIDGNSQNNKIENLRLICSNCDSQLSTYKSRNKGKGRYSRRVRYSNGQSY